MLLVTSSNKTIDQEYVKHYWNLVNPENKNHKFQCFQKDGKATAKTNVDSVEKLIELCERYNLKGLSCLSVNITKKEGTKTYDITEIHNILIDVDVKKNRKKDGVSTDKDKKIAYNAGKNIIKKLEEEINLRVSLFVDSGNGYHLYIPVKIDLSDFFTGKNENDNKELWYSSDMRGKFVRLEELLKEFDNEVVEIDCISKDIARRVKIPGTWNVKNGIEENDYRLSTIVESHSDALSDVLTDGNTKVFNGFEPIKEQEIEQGQEILIDETTDLNEILQSNLKAKRLFNGDWKSYKFKSKSEAELSLAVILFKHGLPEERIRLALSRSEIGKWKKSPKQYRELTIKKAKKFVSKIEKKKSEQVLKTINKGNLKLEILDPDSAWTEIKCYEMNDDFVLQPIYHPIRGEIEVTDRKGNIETKKFEKMGILVLLRDCNGNKDILYPSNGKFSESTVYINDARYKIPSEPFYLKSLPSKVFLKRFLDGEIVDGKEIWNNCKDYRKKYLDVGEDTRKFILQTAWDIGTHFHMLFNSYGYQDF